MRNHRIDSRVEYWKYTGDDSFVNLTKQALLFQVGEHNDYMPINQTRTEGNDDQGFWGLAVMSAAEYNFPHPDDDQPQWLALAQAVFNTQAARWDDAHCNGGLRWQIFQWNNGYNYKNSISQACFFALGARLALYTGNDTYADWAKKTWDWMVEIEFINTTSWAVYDGAHIETGCTNIVPYQFSYNVGGMILGAAAMYNLTESSVWKDRLDNLLNGVKVFFTGPNKDIMTEVACEPVNLCNLDQQSFKAYLSRWLAVTTQWAPYTYDTITPLLRASAVAAAKQCQGGDNGRMCGLVWNKDKYDGTTGVGQQMASMEITLSCMIKQRAAPLTAHTGGTSKGDPDAGSEDMGRTEPESNLRPITAGDKAGAAILTALVVGLFVASMIWIVTDETSEKNTVEQFRDFSSAATAAAMALTAGGGLATILHRRKESEFDNEKAVAVLHSSDDSSRDSAEKEIAVPSAVLVSNIRNMDPTPARRVSSMPIGWSHNRSRSQSVGSGGIFAAYDAQSRADLARDREVLNATPITSFVGMDSNERVMPPLQTALAKDTQPPGSRNGIATMGISTKEATGTTTYDIVGREAQKSADREVLPNTTTLLPSIEAVGLRREIMVDEIIPQTRNDAPVDHGPHEFVEKNITTDAATLHSAQEAKEDIYVSTLATFEHSAQGFEAINFTINDGTTHLPTHETREEIRTSTHSTWGHNILELDREDVSTDATAIIPSAGEVKEETRTSNHDEVEHSAPESRRDAPMQEMVVREEGGQSTTQSSDNLSQENAAHNRSRPTVENKLVKEEDTDTNDVVTSLNDATVSEVTDTLPQDKVVGTGEQSTTR